MEGEAPSAVETGAEPRIHSARKAFLRAARALTTPLVPDDYIALLNPMWTTRELQGLVEDIHPETTDASTIVIRPNSPLPGHRAGQYLRIGAEINGVRHWRAYSITSDPDHPEGLLSITVKYVENGKMSPFFVRQLEPGSLVFLGEVEGTFVLGDEPPAQALFISAGSGVTPIMSMVRELARREALADVAHVHCVRRPDDFIFGDMLHGLSKAGNGYDLQVHLSSEKGRIKPSDLDRVCPDWRDRDAFISGPSDLLDAFKAHWDEHADPERLAMERFQPVIGTGDSEVGSGGTVRFRVTDVEAECDRGISILVGGEDAGAALPFGCRMGICHTCVGRLRQGKVRDLRTGELHEEEGAMIRTCVNAPEGHIEVDL